MNMAKNVFGLLSLLLTLSYFTADGQGTRIIKFKQEQLHTKPTAYFIASVKDDRADTTTIGSVRASVLSKKTVSLNFPGGAAAALDEFLKANLVQSNHEYGFTLHIEQLEVGEKTGGLRAESEIRITVGFYAGGNKIATYRSTNSVNGNVDATRYIEELIRRGLDNILQEFDDWCRANKEQVQAIFSGPSVRVEVEMKDESGDTGQMAYTSRRPLILQDFRGRPDDLSRAAAATFSGIEVRYAEKSQYGQTTVTVSILPFFDFNRSWCRTGSRTNKTLQHEQQHFNITAIKACELATAIRAHSFSPENYRAELEKLYKQIEKETQARQDLYDSETNHGQITAEQDKWVLLVKEELGKQACYQK
jgi:hypothetical protein